MSSFSIHNLINFVFVKGSVPCESLTKKGHTMRVFVTGATGFVGSAVVQELLAAGHQVLGLVRSDASAERLTSTGAEAHRGDLNDLDSLRSGVAAADAVIHTAFIHDFSNFQANCETDRRAIEAMGAALAGSGKTLIITSGTGLLAPGRLSTEDDMPASGPGAFPRVASEEAAAAVAANGVKVAVVRLPPTVHGDGDHGFIPMLINLAREKGVAAYIGEGANRWAAVHRLDAAKLYRLLLEKNAVQTHYHAVAEEGIPFRQITEVIGRKLNIPVASKTGEDAVEHFGWFTHFASMDSQTSSEKSRKALDWQPTHQGLIADLESGSYF